MRHGTRKRLHDIPHHRAPAPRPLDAHRRKRFKPPTQTAARSVAHERVHQEAVKGCKTVLQHCSRPQNVNDLNGFHTRMARLELAHIQEVRQCQTTTAAHKIRTLQFRRNMRQQPLPRLRPRPSVRALLGRAELFKLSYGNTQKSMERLIRDIRRVQNVQDPEMCESLVNRRILETINQVSAETQMFCAVSAASELREFEIRQESTLHAISQKLKLDTFASRTPMQSSKSEAKNPLRQDSSSTNFDKTSQRVGTTIDGGEAGGPVSTSGTPDKISEPKHAIRPVRWEPWHSAMCAKLAALEIKKCMPSLDIDPSLFDSLDMWDKQLARS